jgi:23S rRNA (uracil1939-C5)-methyltransferase
MQRWPEVVGVNLNIQPIASNVVLGPETHQVAGRSWLLERFAGQELRIAADTFFQVNTAQAERVVPLLTAFFSETAESQVLEAYSGIGTFSLPLAAAGLDVLGLELHPGSVKQARANAERNQLPRARFEQADVAASLAEHLTWAASLLVDPPRKGLTAEVMEAILQAPPSRLAYISCNPATLARDLGRLTSEAGYRLRPVQPVDFFPQTSHVECVALLERD